MGGSIAFDCATTDEYVTFTGNSNDAVIPFIVGSHFQQRIGAKPKLNVAW